MSRMVPKLLKQRVKAAVLRQVERPFDLLKANPWTSPNIWDTILGIYRNKTAPSIFEFGAGVSSINHIRHLLRGGGGTYTAAEHQREWFAKTCGAVTELLLAGGHDFKPEVSAAETSTDFRWIIQLNNNTCVVTLKYRPAINYTEGDGNREQFADYIRAAGPEQYDLIVVDGRSRNGCVSHVLERRLLTPGGALALMEAGRGTPNWLEQPTFTGDFDYQPSVRRLLELGAELIDGDGYYTWPSDSTDPLGPRLSPPIPMECCLLRADHLKATA